jgi:hypothetical protein
LQNRVDGLVKLQENQPLVPDELLRDKVLDAITRLRIQNLRRQIRELNFLEADAQESGDREMARSYFQTKVPITSRIRGLEQAMNDRTMAGRRQREDSAVRVPVGEE